MARRVFTVKGEQGTKQGHCLALVGSELGWFGPGPPSPHRPGAAKPRLGGQNPWPRGRAGLGAG